MKLSELEIKIQIDSPEHYQHVFNDCQKLFGQPTSKTGQLDEYYDTPDRQLKAQDLVIRIRSIGDKRMIALKSPQVRHPTGISNRIELEFLAAEGNKVQQQLHAQGLEAYESAEKERCTFVYNDIEIVLDTLPFIGSFIEIEGPSEAAINEIVHLLKLSSYPVIFKNYGELMTEKFRQMKLPLSNIHATFAEEAKLLKSGRIDV